MSEIINLIIGIVMVIIGSVIVDGVIGGITWNSPISSVIANHIFPTGPLFVLVSTFVYTVIEH